MTYLYKSYTIDVQARYGGFLGLVVEPVSGRLREGFARESEEQALVACKMWIDALESGAYEDALSGKADLSGAVFTGGVTLPNFDALRIDGTFGDFVVRMNDGTGRLAMYYNSTTGVSPTFVVSGEDAAKILITTSGQYVFYWASGAGAVAGDPITWQEIVQFSRFFTRFRSGDGDAATSEYVAIRGSNSGSPSVRAEGAAADVDLFLDTKGAGRVRFGTYVAGAPTADGYVTIKTSTGATVRLLAESVP